MCGRTSLIQKHFSKDKVAAAISHLKSDIPMRRKWLNRGNFYVQVLISRSLYLPFSVVIMCIVECRIEYVYCFQNLLQTLLNEQSEGKQETVVPIKEEEIKEEEISEIDAREGAIEMQMEEPSEQDIFMPTHTLPRTPPPQPLALPPSEEVPFLSIYSRG